MSKSFKNKYTVNNVPFYFKPFFWLYGYGLGLILFLFLIAYRITLKVNFEGKENLDTCDHHILCFWHENLFGFYLCFHDHRGFDFMGHPGWYMKPIHVLVRLYGAKDIFYGSTGNAGLEAAIKLAGALATGRSTYINPDGPYGPLHKLNKGVLHLSKNGKTPIIPVNFKYGKHMKQSGWDQKRMPYPFSSVTVQISAPIQVNETNFEESGQQLRSVLIDGGAASPQ